MTIDVPSGRVVARVRYRAGGAVEGVAFRNVPSYVVARGACRRARGVDVAYGGRDLRVRAGRARSGCGWCPTDLPA